MGRVNFGTKGKKMHFQKVEVGFENYFKINSGSLSQNKYNVSN